MVVRYWHAFLGAATVPLLVAAAFVAGHVTRQTTVHGLVTKHSTYGQVSALFHMGTDNRGVWQYNNMACAGTICAWDYAGGTGRKHWRVTLQLEEPKAAPATPPMMDARQ